jgi:hypothetical protein
MAGDSWPEREGRWACMLSDGSDRSQWIVQLDGDFTSAELRQIAEWMDTP